MRTGGRFALTIAVGTFSLTIAVGTFSLTIAVGTFSLTIAVGTFSMGQLARAGFSARRSGCRLAGHVPIH